MKENSAVSGWHDLELAQLTKRRICGDTSLGKPGKGCSGDKGSRFWNHQVISVQAPSMEGGTF